MRGNSSWSTVKPILKVLQDYFSNAVHTAHIIKPDNFWQKQRTNLGSQKYKFEVRVFTSGTILFVKFLSNFSSGNFKFETGQIQTVLILRQNIPCSETDATCCCCGK